MTAAVVVESTFSGRVDADAGGGAGGRSQDVTHRVAPAVPAANAVSGAGGSGPGVQVDEFAD
ncbi:MAG: hypothetical protein WA823_15845, partial [Candidatus Acidiferrales bacterium]